MNTMLSWNTNFNTTNWAKEFNFKEFQKLRDEIQSTRRFENSLKIFEINNENDIKKVANIIKEYATDNYFAQIVEITISRVTFIKLNFVLQFIDFDTANVISDVRFKNIRFNISKYCSDTRLLIKF